MSENCRCPICRFAEGELAPNEIGWYLKGCIEQQSKYLKLIKEAKSLDELREQVKYDRADLAGDYTLLGDLKTSKRNSTGWWDEAMDCPTVYNIKTKE